MRNLTLIILIILGYEINSYGQDIHFSNLTGTSMYNSVASAGASDAKLRNTLHYRSQWGSIGSSFKTYSLASDYKLEMDNLEGSKIGIGLMLFKDQQGELNLNKLQAKISLAYHQKVSQYSFMSGGVQFGLTQHSIDGSKAEWHNQFDGVKHDASLPSYQQALFSPILTFDVGAGILWRYDTKSKNRFTDNPFSTINLGISVYQLVGSGLSYNGGEAEKMKYVAFGNAAFYIKDQIMELEPSFLYQLKGKEQELVFGMLFRRIFVEPSYYTGYYKRFDLAVGSYYRVPNDAIIPTVSMNYDSFGVGVSYDINLSELNQASNYQGGLEIFLKYMLR